MSETDQTLTLPPIVWIGGHPTVDDPELRGTRLRRCLRCDLRGQWEVSRCEPGLIVHLIDPADIHAAPEAFDGVAWAEPGAVAYAHAHWRDRGYTVTRKPDGPTGEQRHPRFRACPVCNERGMREGRVGPVRLPAPPAPARQRGWGNGRSGTVAGQG